MEKQVVLTLSGKAYLRAQGMAKRTGSTLAEVLTSTIEHSLLSPGFKLPEPTSSITDSATVPGQSNGKTLTEQMYGIVKPTLSEEELEELYYEQ